MLPKTSKPIIKLKTENRFKILCFVNKACIVIVHMCFIGTVINQLYGVYWGFVFFLLIILFMNKLNQSVRFFCRASFCQKNVISFNPVTQGLPHQNDPAASSNDEKRHGTRSRVSYSDVPPGTLLNAFR